MPSNRTLRWRARGATLLTVALLAIGIATAGPANAAFYGTKACPQGQSVIIYWTAPADKVITVFVDPLGGLFDPEDMVWYGKGSGNYNTGYNWVKWGFGSPYSKNLTSYSVKCTTAF